MDRMGTPKSTVSTSMCATNWAMVPPPPTSTCLLYTSYRDEYLSYIMTNDTHSPGITRVNAVLSATDDFYTAFGVREGDGMYRRPEDRPHIW